jgi:hypothetical protein
MTSRRCLVSAVTGVTVNDVRLTHLGVLEAGQRLRTGADGRIVFSLGGDRTASCASMPGGRATR